MLVIVVYMPVDYGDSDALDDYIIEHGFLEGLLDNEVYDYVVTLADCITDLHTMADCITDLRTKDSHCSRRLTNFLREYR